MKRRRRRAPCPTVALEMALGMRRGPIREEQPRADGSVPAQGAGPLAHRSKFAQWAVAFREHRHRRVLGGEDVRLDQLIERRQRCPAFPRDQSPLQGGNRIQLFEGATRAGPGKAGGRAALKFVPWTV